MRIAGGPGPFFRAATSHAVACGSCNDNLYIPVTPKTRLMPPTMKQTSTVLATLVLLLLTFDLALAAPLTAEDLFRPFEYLNLTQTYDRYAALIDLFIYILVFVGLAQATLAHRYGNTGGRAVAIGAGTCLAVAMVVAEETYHFSIKSFGPFAASLLILILGIMVFTTLHRAGMPAIPSGSVAYLLGFFSIYAVAPELINWLNETMPLLGAGMVIGLLLGVLGALSAFWPHSLPTVNVLHKPSRWKSQDTRRREALGQEVRLIQRDGKRAVREGVRDSRNILSNLTHVRNAIRRDGHNPARRARILESLQRVVPEEEKLWRDVQSARDLHERLVQFDESALHEDARERFQAMTSEEKAAARKRLNDELAKLGVERRISRIEELLRERLEALARRVSETAALLSGGDVDQALTAVDRAIAEENAIQKLAREAKGFEKSLLRLARKGFLVAR